MRASRAPTVVCGPAGEAVSATDDSRLDASFSDRYAPRATLGEGGMGVVELRDDVVIGRRVAMKTIRAEAAAVREARPRFLREARIQGQLEHPSIVPVYDLGTDPDGRVYFTMKRVRGVTLADVLQRLRDEPGAAEKYSLRKLLVAFTTVCQCIEFAHERGVVHRDLKPANIMLGDHGEVYVLDWGIARVAADPRVGRESGLDLREGHRGPTRSILGTPGYMAPEQLVDLAAVDARSDVYALGAILFEILTLQYLHAGSSADAIVRSTLDGADARVTVRAPDRGLSPELEALCVRATAVAPASRFPSAGALALALDGLLDRDQEIATRRRLAEAHLEAATSLLGCAERRPEAIREINRALALDPDNEHALAAIARMLTPPDETPSEVLNELEAVERDRRRYVAKIAALGYASFFLYLPVFLWMGVRDVPLFVAVHAVILLTSAWTFAKAHFGDVSLRSTYGVLVMSNACFALSSVFFGPLVLIPAPVIANSIGFCLLYPDRARRALAVALGLACIVGPVLVDALGLIPSWYSFTEGGMTIHSMALRLPPALTIAVLTLTSVTPIIAGALAVGRLRDALHRVELRLHTHGWQLRQLLPQGAVSSGVPAPARTRV